MTVESFDIQQLMEKVWLQCISSPPPDYIIISGKSAKAYRRVLYGRSHAFKRLRGARGRKLSLALAHKNRGLLGTVEHAA